MYYQIGEFSRIAQISIKTIRYYHEIDLLSPIHTDKDSGYRFYNEKSLDRVRIISNLKELNFSLNEIKKIFQDCNDDTDIHQYLVDKATQIKEKINKYKKIEKQINSIIQLENDMKNIDQNSEVIIKDISNMAIIGIKFKGRYQDVGKAFGTLFKNYARYMVGKPFSLYYDEGFMGDQATIEGCAPVKEVITNPKDGISSRILQGGKAISTIHKGPYSNLGDSYKRITDYYKKNNFTVNIPSREIYHKGPGMIFRGNPKKYITEIQLLLDE